MTTIPPRFPTLGTAIRSRLWPHRRFDPVRIVRALPAALAITLLVIAAGIFTHGMSTTGDRELLERIGTDVRDFDARRLLAMPIATFVQSSPGVRWHMVLLVLIPLALLESVIGHWRAAAIWLLSDWISAPITLVAIWALAELGSNSATQLLDSADAGSSAAAHGTIAALCLTLPGRWSAAALATLFAVDFGAFTFERIDAAIAHTVASAVGLGLGLIVLRRRRLWSPAPASLTPSPRALNAD